MLTWRQYDEAFELECRNEYPVVDAYESLLGFSIDRFKLETMARELACPLKVNPPNWQHGRVLYATARHFLSKAGLNRRFSLLDIGTAKGFSACVLSHAIADEKSICDVVSIDVVDPNSRVRRNSVVELDGLKTVEEFVKGHVAESVMVIFCGRGSTHWLTFALAQKARIPFAFVDGKHSYDAVVFEGAALMRLQRPGDVIVFDDIQLEPVGHAVRDMKGYSVDYLDIGVRIYAVARRV